MAKEEQTFTKAEVSAMISEAVGAAIPLAVRAAIEATKPDPSFDNETAKFEKLKNDARNRKLRPERTQRVKSIDTGATFTMAITESREFPSGKITRLDNYEKPDVWDKHVAEGGPHPDGLDIFDNVTGKMLPLSQQVVYETYIKADLANLVGKSWDYVSKRVEVLTDPAASPSPSP